jgi:predicted enzyme related to lactoylglutathione lyase
MADTILALVVISSPDINVLKAFYEKLDLTFVEERHGKGPVHYSTLIGKTVFEIYPLSPGQTLQVNRLGFGVENIDMTVAKLIASGFRVLSVPKQTDYGYRAFAKDPDGRTVEICAN